MMPYVTRSVTAYVHTSTFFRHVHTNPSTSSSKNINIAIDAPTVNPLNATANGSRNIASTSKTRNTIAYR